MERNLRYSWIIPGTLAVGEAPRTWAGLLGLGDVYRKVAGAHPPTEPTAEQLLALTRFLQTGTDGILPGRL